MSEAAIIPFGWERTALAVEKVKDRLRRASTTLAEVGIPYAVVGGNAVAEWVGRVDEAAVRNTQDVDILIRRPDFERAKAALESAGFVHSNMLGLDVFLDGLNAKPRDAIHIIFSSEKVRS